MIKRYKAYIEIGIEIKEKFDSVSIKEVINWLENRISEDIGHIGPKRIYIGGKVKGIEEIDENKA